MLKMLKEYYNDVKRGYRNILVSDELEHLLYQAIKEIERLQSEKDKTEQELVNLKRDIGWTNK